ncbi:MAG TPA: hypothetical protein VK837_02445 [Longimicrobiales bacterium]|nr:hypothetical protein [Longimicrobiales bacterium]
MRTSSAVIGLSLALAVCFRVGGWEAEQRFEYGDQVEIRTAGGELLAELILVRDEGIVVLGETTAYALAWADIERMDFRRFPVDRYEADDGIPSAPVRERLARASRYPYGLSDDQLARFLGALGQTELAPPP